MESAFLWNEQELPEKVSMKTNLKETSMKLIFSLLLFSTFAEAQIKSAYLTNEQQKYYKNDSFDGNNQRERIDSAVIEINKLHGELAGLKAEMQALKRDVEELKQKK